MGSKVETDNEEKVEEIIQLLHTLILDTMIDALEKLNATNQDRMIYQTTMMVS